MKTATQLKSAERQIYEYCQNFESINDFKHKSEIHIELENDGLVIMEYTNIGGTIYIDKFLEYDENDKPFLTIEQRTHLKYQFIEEIENRYNELIDWDEINRDYYIEEKIDKKLWAI